MSKGLLSIAALDVKVLGLGLLRGRSFSPNFEQRSSGTTIRGQTKPTSGYFAPSRIYVDSAEEI
jgi:hypothetical protein